MYRLSFTLIFFVLLTCTLHAQSPHGKGFAMDCAKCHDSKSWKFSTKNTKFNHNETSFKLTGQHKEATCKACHTTLKFKNTPSNCVSCHADMHNQTVGNDCARCHTSNSWIVENITSMHEQTSFPLTGVHATVDCNKCHQNETNLRFKPIGLNCVDCHNKDFKASINPSHVKLKLSSDCASCHTQTPDWSPAAFPDHNSFYPLTGAHVAIAKDCEKCHIGGNYTNTPSECVVCHKLDFNKTLNPNHAKIGLSTDCASCHSTTPGWKPASFPVHNDYYPLTGAHTTIAKNCAECHKGDYNNTPNDCNSCHSTDFKKTLNPNHQKLGFSTDCASCHTTSPNWSPATFAAHNNFYPLTGAHATTKCNECHKGGNFEKTPNDCNSCHNTDYKATTAPNHVTFKFSTDCVSCHTTNPNWSPATFAAHNDFYPLTGAHAKLACSECHKAGNYTNTPKDCNSCHKTAFNAAKSPNHTALGLSTDCASCHTTNPGWRPSTFNHNSFYPLTGAHNTIANDCAKCHKSGNIKNTPTDCNSCHNTVFNAAKSPNHAALGLSTDCASCHTTSPGWRPSTFNHANYYPLTGAHNTIANDCAKCHKSGNIKNTPTDCNSCHNASYQAAKNPDHSAIGLSTDCASCHTTNPGWRPSTFNHNSFYPLTGAHAAIASNCNQCHTGSNSKKPPTDCNACHNPAFNGAKNPNHAVLGLSTDCASCHTTNPGWRPTSFNHNNYYPLTGAHAAIASNCTQCHSSNVANTPKDCIGCHTNAYNSAQNPNHATAGFSKDCASCHTTNPNWRPSTFNHNNFYPLTGAHANIASNCTACHAGGRFKNTPTDCNACHSGAYNGASNPNHAASGFSRDCASCHTTNPGWRPSTFNHNNFYPLTGAHANIASNCAACHAGGRFSNTPTDCNSCHSGAYNGANNPNHSAIRLSRDCASCHTTNPSWRPTTFNHNNHFALVGAHARIASNCTACHSGGNYNHGSCYSCHSGDYNRASPNHAASGFPTDCTNCHSQNSWKPATWNHDAQYFPIYSGAHRGKWNNCNECHTASGNYSVFNCLNCHKKGETDNDHKKVKGYNYDSNSCYACHPRGKS